MVKFNPFLPWRGGKGESWFCHGLETGVGCKFQYLGHFTLFMSGLSLELGQVTFLAGAYLCQFLWLGVFLLPLDGMHRSIPSYPKALTFVSFAWQLIGTHLYSLIPLYTLVGERCHDSKVSCSRTKTQLIMKPMQSPVHHLLSLFVSTCLSS